ncbi:MAG TPA: glycine cleavage system protein GcvH [Alphaproteobacteria bacterium]|jgi:glycine cleavage system H protein|nr:glycine cleavage system protein GcvH [Alphaproteobacteria bacterium]
MANIKFTKDHEWIRIEGETATVGITDYAQQQLGDVVFVELPDVGKALERGKDAAVVESVKAASEVFAPVDGEVTEINKLLQDQPDTVNSDPQGEGWFFKVKLADIAQLDALMNETEYNNMIAEHG